MAGNCDLAVKETDVQETLELLGERLAYDPPKGQWAPWVPPTHPLAYVENALRYAPAQPAFHQCLCGVAALHKLGVCHVVEV